jgi:hypothetical protein
VTTAPTEAACQLAAAAAQSGEMAPETRRRVNGEARAHERPRNRGRLGQH